jgi:hypothetical protein
VEARQSLESQRNGGIDALRAAVTLLVVLHHTAIAYGAEGGWYYRETAPNSSLSGRLLVLFCTTNQAWFMGFFFLLAGYYTPPAFERRGAAAFLKSRWLRLGTPLLFYALAIHPVVVALAQTAHDRPFAQTLLSLWSHARFEPGPLWFAEALLIFAALYVAWRLLTAKAPRVRAFPSNLALLTAALAAGAAAFGLRLIWPVGVNVGFLQLGYFSGYVVLFWAGAWVRAAVGWKTSRQRNSAFGCGSRGWPFRCSRPWPCSAPIRPGSAGAPKAGSMNRRSSTRSGSRSWPGGSSWEPWRRSNAELGHGARSGARSPAAPTSFTSSIP